MSPVASLYGEEFIPDIVEICKPISKMFDVTFFCQTRAFHNGQFSSLMTSTSLTEYYVEKKYPIYCSQGHGLILEPGFYLSAYMGNQPVLEKIRHELRNLFNVDHVLHIVDKHEDYDDMYSFATIPENNQMVNQFINNMDVVKHFLLYYKDKTANLIKRTAKVAYTPEYFDLPNMTPDLFQSSQINKNCLHDMTIKKIFIPDHTGGVSISQREFECLGYIAKSYSFKEIAKILNLSPRTIETYVNNLKYKLKCENRAQLIKMADKLNLL